MRKVSCGFTFPVRLQEINTVGSKLFIYVRIHKDLIAEKYYFVYFKSFSVRKHVHISTIFKYFEKLTSN